LHYQSGFNVYDITAVDTFLSVGQQLQKQQQYEAWNSVSVFLKDQPVPAESNPELESMLQKNATEYTARMRNVRLLTCICLTARLFRMTLLTAHTPY
jgi:hypothetical protein